MMTKEWADDWVLVRWRKGLDVFTPYLDGPRHWATGVRGFSADWEEIACGNYDYIKTLKRMLEDTLKLEKR